MLLDAWCTISPVAVYMALDNKSLVFNNWNSSNVLLVAKASWEFGGFFPYNADQSYSPWLMVFAWLRHKYKCSYTPLIPVSHSTEGISHDSG